MSAGPRRIVYRSQGRERLRRRTRRLLATVLVVSLVAIAVGGGVTVILARGGARARPRPAAGTSSPPAEALRTAALAAVSVHRGQRARLRYRVEAPAGTSWTASVAIVTASGTPVRVRRVGGPVLAGVRQTLTVRINLPPGHYRYLVHVHDAEGHTESFAAAARLRVLAPLLPSFPSARNTAAAVAWAARRRGEVAVAVVDTNGRASGYHEHEPFQAASLAKAILLVGYLRLHPAPDATLDAAADTMIEDSDNDSADAIFAVVGSKGMSRVAKLAGMQDYEQGSGWIDTRVSAADEARFFYNYEKYVPAPRLGFARTLLSGVTRMQRWGIPAAAGPAGWKVYFKAGWLGLDNHLMDQAAWLVKGAQRWALAIMTDDDPTPTYGWDTEKGITDLLLGEQPQLGTVLED